MSDPVFITSRSRLVAVVETAVHKAVREALAQQKEPAMPAKRWLTNREAQAYLGLSKATLARYRAVGRLPYSCVQSAVYYRLADVEALLKKGMRSGQHDDATML